MAQASGGTSCCASRARRLAAIKCTRQLQRALAQRAARKTVPNADVVIVNPEHYAVALKYDEQRAEAQWQLRSDSLAKLMTQADEFDEREEAALLAGLQRTHASLERLFGTLSTQPNKPPLGTPARAVADEFESRLAGQIGNKMQTMIADVL
eukprot:gene32478-43392_t